MSWEGIKEYKESIYESLEMPFGKYKGKHPSKLPLSYCKWLRENDIDKKIGKNFKKAIGSKLWNHKRGNFYCQNDKDIIPKGKCKEQCYNCTIKIF